MERTGPFPAGWASRAGSAVRVRVRRRDLVLPLVVLVLQLGATAAVSGQVVLAHVVRPGPLEWALLVAGPVALVERRRHPVAALWVSAAATFAPATSGLAYPALIVAFFLAVLSGHRWPAWSAVALRLVCSIWLIPVVYGDAVPPINDILLLVGWLTVLVVVAEALRLQMERVAQSKAARQAQQRRQESEERLWVARDLHDVVGHNISLINVQASVGLKLLDSEPEAVRVALGAIKAASKEALEELRAMLATLRRDEDAAPRSPAPGLDRLTELVELTKAAGLGVEVEVAGEVNRLPTAVQLAAYRILQESLTNVTRHASSARARVRLAFDGMALLVEVADDGKRRLLGRPPATGVGSGIAGMAERAAALGGELKAGPRPDGGFTVRARLPVGKAT